MLNRRLPSIDRQLLVSIAVAWAVFLLQVGAIRINNRLEQKLDISQFDLDPSSFLRAALTLTLFTVALSAVSGALLGAVISFPLLERSGKGRLLIGAIVLGLFPASGVTLKLLRSQLIFPFSPLRPFSLELYDWALYSQVPSFWLGLIIGWAARQFRSLRSSP